MGLFSKDDPKTIPGRAFVVPHDVGNLYGNVNELAVNAKVLTHVRLEISSTTDNRPGSPGSQAVQARISNWMRIVMTYSGSNYGPHDQLPAEIHLPVNIDEITRRIVSIDLEQAEVELVQYREVARRFWLETEAPLAPIRAVKQLPGAAIREGKGLLSTWRKALGDFKDELQADSATGTDGRPAPPKGPAWNEKEVEQARRTAVTLRYRLEKHPQEHAKLRASTLASAPSQAEQVIAGYRHPLDFEHWLMYQEVSGVISTDEANDYRRQAGLL